MKSETAEVNSCSLLIAVLCFKSSPTNVELDVVAQLLVTEPETRWPSDHRLG